MILWNERQWRREMLLCALVFQVIFLVELVGLWEMIVVDPGVHRISYENWAGLINDWQAPAYWENYFLRILSVALALNWVAQVLFWANAVYVWLHRERFGHSRPAIAVEIVLVTAAALFVRWYIKYHVDFYRLFMYAILPGAAHAPQLVWVLKGGVVLRQTDILKNTHKNFRAEPCVSCMALPGFLFLIYRSSRK